VVGENSTLYLGIYVRHRRLPALHVEYAEQRLNYGVLFTFSPSYEYSHLEYEHVPVEYRVHQAEYGIHIRVAASHEYVNTYSTRRLTAHLVPTGAKLAYTIYCCVPGLLCKNQYYSLHTHPLLSPALPPIIAYTIAQSYVSPGPPVIAIYTIPYW